MEVVFLGTSCMVPTKERNHQSMFITSKKETFLIDCGEGTQRQLKIAGIKPTRIKRLFISHWHGDHVLGLPGLLQTLNASDYEGKMTIYGPKGTKKQFEYLYKAFLFTIQFEHEIVEITKDTEIELKDHFIQAKYLKHSLPCLGYNIIEKDIRKIKTAALKKYNIPQGPLIGKLQDGKTILQKGKKITPDQVSYIQKGKKIAILLDSIPCKAMDDLAQNADLLVSEAVYTHNLLAKAEEYMHMTATQAAQIAARTNVKKLLLTHLSQRYKTGEEIEQEAKNIFPNTYLAHDFLKIKI